MLVVVYAYCFCVVDSGGGDGGGGGSVLGFLQSFACFRFPKDILIDASGGSPGQSEVFSGQACSQAQSTYYYVDCA